MVPHGEDVEVRRCHCALHFGVFDVSELSNSIDRPHFAANQFLIDWIIQGGKSSG